MKKIVWIGLSLAILSILILFIGLQYRAYQIRKIEKIVSNITEKIISEMDDETLIRQLFMFYIQLNDVKILQELMPGGLFINTGNIPVYANGQPNLSLLGSYIENVNNIYRQKNIPQPFYSIDQEGGRIRRIKSGTVDFPSAMAIGEAYASTKQKDLPLLTGFYTCLELRRFGIQWPLTPVVDVQINPDNPVIGTRSFGSDPELVTLMADQYIQGLQNGRCLSSIKHFPGHGDTNQDSHRELPYINKSETELNLNELYPYEKLVKSKQPPHGLMSAHIIFNHISPEPATVSHTWLTEKLRNTWGYEGIIVTDDLAMNAMNIYQKKENIDNIAIKAFLAGADVLLYVFKPGESRAMVNSFIQAYRKKIISEKRLHESARRIIYRKINLGLMDSHIRDHMTNWTPEMKRDSEIWLQRSGEIETNIKRIESQLARVESVNEFISKKGIKTIFGKPETESNVQNFPLFTDVPSSNPIYKQLQEKAVKLYALNEISETKCLEKCVILHTMNNSSLEFFLGQKKNKPWIIYTMQEPFPARKLKGYLSKNDILISTFSDTETSRDKLIETWAGNVIPPKSSVIYEGN